MSENPRPVHETPVYRRRYRWNQLVLTLCCAAFAFAVFWLSWILWTLISHGGEALISSGFFTAMTPPPGEQGGMVNAIVGSLLIVSAATLIGAPVGVLAGIYLSEYGRYGWHRRFAATVRFLNDILLSAPSIIIGLFVYALVVAKTKHFSGYAGSLALSLIVIPVVLRTTDEMLRLIPSSLREAAIALGCPLWKMVLQVTLKAAKNGVVTALLLAVARISGETAPLLFTALSNQFMSWDMSGPLANLPVVMFQFAMSPYNDWRQLAWGGALLTTLAVLVLNISARILARERL